MLWFGDERGYNATYLSGYTKGIGCGLVMKEDITQPISRTEAPANCCGLVMKEDITQQRRQNASALMSCGLVMKEDITQLKITQGGTSVVVVW